MHAQLEVLFQLMTIFGSAAFVAVCILSLSATNLGRKAASAPGLLLVIGAAISLFYRALGLPNASVMQVAGVAEAALAALAFVSAAQFKISRFSGHCPAAFRLTLGGAPIFLLACSLTAFILLPQLNLASALLLGGALMLNGAAFDRRSVINTPAPSEIKSAVRLESAAIIALGTPVALLLAANATAAGTNEPAISPLLQSSIAILKGFVFGGIAGLMIARFANHMRKKSTALAQNIDVRVLTIGAIGVFCCSGFIGGEPIVAALAAGLLWGEETKAVQTTRLRMRRIVEQGLTPAIYLAFGCLFAPRILQADMLSIVFALAAITVMRAGPRLAILQTPELPKESQAFLAWFGGAPGAASALFIILILGTPAIINQEAILTVGSLAVVTGVIAARLTSKPLAKIYLKQRALANKRRMFAN